MSEFKLEISVSRGFRITFDLFFGSDKKKSDFEKGFFGWFQADKRPKNKKNRLRRQQNFNTLRPICTFYTYFFFLKVVKVPKVKICFTAELES